MPVCAMSTPGTERSASTDEVPTCCCRSSGSSTEIDAGASRIFSWRRDAETTTVCRLDVSKASSMVMSRLSPASSVIGRCWLW